MPVFINKGFSTISLTLGYNRGQWLVNPGDRVKVTDEEFQFLKDTKQYDKRVLLEFKPSKASPKKEEPVVDEIPQVEDPPAQDTPEERVEIPTFTSTKAALIEFARDHNITVNPESTKSDIYNAIKENLK